MAFSTGVAERLTSHLWEMPQSHRHILTSQVRFVLFPKPPSLLIFTDKMVWIVQFNLSRTWPQLNGCWNLCLPSRPPTPLTFASTKGPHLSEEELWTGAQQLLLSLVKHPVFVCFRENIACYTGTWRRHKLEAWHEPLPTWHIWLIHAVSASVLALK